MSTELQRRLYAMEVEPPAEVWKKLSLALDEINADNRIAGKMENAEVDPHPSVWKRISNALYGEVTVPAATRRTPVISLKKLVAAAIVIGLIATSYFVFFNNNSQPGIAVNPPGNQVAPDSTPSTTVNRSPEALGKASAARALASISAPSSNPVVRSYQSNLNNLPRKNRSSSASPILVASITNDQASMSKLEEKTFNQSLDDVSLVGSQSGYMTMVSADGRLVKIPEKYTVIAPYLQDKSDENSLIDFLFGGEGEYWKDMFRQWRQKLAQSAITPSHDNFFDIISLLKTIQDNQ